MTQEEKAKRYDEALKVLHKYDGANIMFSQSLKEEMFPELREESEDERIRKALINGLKRYDDGTLFNGCLVREILAWLEKQDEQKPAWSEEDEKKMESIIGSIRFNSFMNNTLAPIYELDIRWLKSLKDRVQPQQEKERILGKLEEWLDEYISNLADVGTDTLIGSFRKYLDGKLPVKSLSQWKPSDEQMEALRVAYEVGTANESWAMDKLKGLYQELKKLREE